MVKHQRQVNPNEKLLLQLHKEGKSYKEIASLVSRSKSTIHYIIKKYNINGNIANEQRSGRPKELTPREEELLLREIKKDPFTSAPKLATMVVTFIHAQLCRRMSWKNNFLNRVPREKPYISKEK